MKLFIALLFAVSPVLGQLEHLKPVEEHFRDIVDSRAHFGYHDLVFDQLFANQPKATAYMLEIASFEPERLLLVCEISGEYYAFLREPKLQIWSNSEKAESKVILTVKAKIDPSLATRIVELWHRELHLTSYPDIDQGGLLDGVHYYVGGTFVHSTGKGKFTEKMIGDIENPAEESRIGAIVAVGEMLVRYLEFPEALRQCLTPDARIRWLDHVIDDNVSIDWPIVLEGPRSYKSDPFLRDPWTEIEKQVSKAENKEANKALVPTATSVTPAADAPVAPAAAAAHL
jgi:hypothetical protein